MFKKPTYEKLEQEVRSLHKELGRKESDFREIQKLASIGNWEWNIEQQILIWSDEVYRIFGFEPSSFKPTVEAFEATIHPDDIKSFLNQREIMLSERKRSCIDHRIVRPDGSIRYVQECTQLMVNDKNEVCRVIGTVQDITSRKQMEETLKNSENKYRALFDNSLEAIFLTTQDGSIFATNQAACHMLEMSEAEIISGGRDAVANLKDPRLLAALEERKKNGKFRGELTYKKKDGTIFPVELSSAVYRDDHGNEMICIFARDITERKYAEEALQISEERLDLAIKGTGIGLWDWYIQTGETVFNERWAEIVGYTLEELSPVSINTWIDLCHPDDLEKSNKLLGDHFAGKTDYYLCETRMKHKEGHWVWVLDRGKVFEWSKEGKPLRATGTHIDIFETKSQENTFPITLKNAFLTLRASSYASSSNNSLFHLSNLS